MNKKDYFKDVCFLIEEGFTISQALDELDIDSRKFYKTITKEQKIMLDQIRTANALYGTCGYKEMEIKDLHEFFTTNDYAY